MNIKLAIFTTATAFIFIGNNLAMAQSAAAAVGVGGAAAAAGATSSAGTDKTEGSQPIGFGGATGMGSGGFAGSAISLAGGSGSPISSSGLGSQIFWGWLHATARPRLRPPGHAYARLRSGSWPHRRLGDGATLIAPTTFALNAINLAKTRSIKMNHPDSETASTFGKTARLSPVAHALFLGLAFLWSGGQAMADSGGYWLVASDGGISGVEVVVTKNPGGIRIVAENAAGNSALRLDGPGDYTVSTVCRQACPAHSISGSLRMPPAGDTSPPIIAILMPILFPVKMVEGVQSSFNFTIKEAGTVVLSGVMPSTRGTVKPMLDVDGNGQRDAVTDGLLILRRSGIANAIEPQPDNVLPGAAISTSRSNIKRPGIANAIEPQPDNVLPGAAINTSRSNIKRPGITAENDSPQPSDRGIGVAVGDFDGDGRSMCCPASGEHFPRDILGIAGNPFVDLPIRLESDPGNIKVSANTDRTGAFHFGKLPAGKYKVILPNLQSQSLTVASDGIASGKVTRSNDGDINIFDRWGTLLASSGSSKDDTPAGNKVATKPGFEPPRSGFAGMGGGGPGILPGMGPGGPGPGPVSPSPGVMSPGGPAGPGGGAMRR